MQRYLLRQDSVEGTEYLGFTSNKTKEQLNNELNQSLKTVERGMLTFQNFEFYKSILENYSVITLEDFWNNAVTSANKF